MMCVDGRLSVISWVDPATGLRCQPALAVAGDGRTWRRAAGESTKDFRHRVTADASATLCQLVVMLPSDGA